MTKPRAQPNQANDYSQYASSRAGANNVAGVNYQNLVAAALLMNGLDSGELLSLVPEGDEDLDVTRETTGETILVQVKFRTRKLSRGDVAGAIIRANQARLLRPDADQLRIGVVSNVDSFGGLTPTGWMRTVDTDTVGLGFSRMVDTIASMSTPQLSEELAAKLLNRTHLVQMEITQSTLSEPPKAYPGALSPLQTQLLWSRVVTLVANVAANNRLSSRTSINSHSLQGLVHDIAASSGAWISKIEERHILEPLDFSASPIEDQLTYLRGIHCTPQHVGAGYAVARDSALAELRQMLDASSGVLIAGPSGAGKSTLMWQLAMTLEGHRRFHVKRLAQADVLPLLAYFRQLAPVDSPPVLLCVDDLGDGLFEGWTTLCSGLSTLPNLKIVSTVREDAFTPEMLDRNVTLYRPNLSLNDAVELAASLRPDMSREDAKILYLDAEGLLMEFVHIAVTSSRLTDTLAAQANRINNLENDSVAKICRLVSVADLAGSTLGVPWLRRQCSGDKEFREAVRLLMDEHLIVQQGSVVTGLHHLRSQYLAKELHSVYPPIDQTILELVETVELDSLVRLARIWIGSRGNSIVEFEAALVDRFLKSDDRAPDAVRVLAQIEAAFYFSDFMRVAPPEEDGSASLLMWSVADGKGVLLRAIMPDLSTTSLGGTLMRRRWERFKHLEKLQDALPEAPSMRGRVCHAVTSQRVDWAERLTANSIELLSGTDAFSPEMMSALVHRALSAYETADCGLDYQEWRDETSRLRLSRAWATRMLAAVSRLNPAAYAFVRNSLPPSAEEAVRLLLSGALQPTKVHVTEQKILVHLGAPPGLLPKHVAGQFFRDALADVAGIFNESFVEYRVPSRKSDKLGKKKFASSNILLTRGMTGLGAAFMTEALYSRRANHFFQWFETLSESLTSAVAAVENVASFVIWWRQQISPDVRRVASLVDELSDLVKRTDKLTTSAPNSYFTLPYVEDRLDTWTFGQPSGLLGSWTAASDQQLSFNLPTMALAQVLTEVRRMIIDEVVERSIDSEEEALVRENMVQVFSSVNEATRFLEAYAGTTASAQFLLLDRAYRALLAICSSEMDVHGDAVVSRGEIMRHLNPSRSSPRHAVNAVLRRWDQAAGRIMEAEKGLAQSASEALGRGWVTFPLVDISLAWSFLSPRWLFVSPPGARQRSAALDALASSPILSRSLIAFRDMDASLGGVVIRFGESWRAAVSQETAIVRRELSRRHGFVFSGSASNEVGWAPEVRFVVLADLISRELTASRAGVFRPSAFELSDLSGHTGYSNMETVVLEQLEREADPNFSGESLAYRVRRTEEPGEDELVDGILQLLDVVRQPLNPQLGSLHTSF